MTDLQQCSRCKCKKLLELFKVRKNTGKILKTCIQCCERYSCEECDGKFATKPMLQRHINDVHLDIRNFQCDQCEYKCYNNMILQNHINSVHLNIRNFQCDDCEYKCHNGIHLQNHINSVHLNIRNFICLECDGKFHTKCHLERHIQNCKGKDNSNMSGLELRTKEALEILGFNRQEDYIFNQSYSKLTDYCGKHLRPDFRFIKHKIIIEVDGEQHYRVKEFGGSKEEAKENFKSAQENDKIKNDFCRIYGYKMIRIKYTEIMNLLEILHSELDEIIEY